jgi:hypothetical protein
MAKMMLWLSYTASSVLIRQYTAWALIIAVMHTDSRLIAYLIDLAGHGEDHAVALPLQAVLDPQLLEDLHRQQRKRAFRARSSLETLIAAQLRGCIKLGKTPRQKESRPPVLRLPQSERRHPSRMSPNCNDTPPAGVQSLTQLMFGYAPKKMCSPVSYQSPSSSCHAATLPPSTSLP